jgi:ERCC4-type nuclease
LAFDVSKIPENTFVIDTREHKKRIKGVQLRAKKLGINTITEALTTGDYCSKYCVIELKAGSDLVQSMTSGRLKRQMDRLLNMPQPVKMLLITGRLLNPKYTNISVNSLIGQMCSLAVQGINIVKVQKKEEVEFIVRLMLKGQKYQPKEVD